MILLGGRKCMYKFEFSRQNRDLGLVMVAAASMMWTNVGSNLGYPKSGFLSSTQNPTEKYKDFLYFFPIFFS